MADIAASMLARLKNKLQKADEATNSAFSCFAMKNFCVDRKN